MIKRINFIWIGSQLPDWADANIKEFVRLNPDYEVNVYGDKVLLPEYKELYGKIKYNESKADLLRYSVLQQFGGWYFDVDFWPLRPIQDIIDEYNITDETFFLTKQQWNNPKLPYANAVLYSDKYNWDNINKEILKIKDPNYQTVFGPALINRLLYDEEFTVGEADMFYPYNKEDAIMAYRAIVNDCDLTFKNNPFMIHLWAGGKRDI